MGIETVQQGYSANTQKYKICLIFLENMLTYFLSLASSKSQYDLLNNIYH